MENNYNFKTIEGMSNMFSEKGSDLTEVYKKFILELNDIGLNPSYHSFVFEQIADISKILVSPKYSCQHSPDTLGTKLDYLFDGLFSASRHTVLP